MATIELNKSNFDTTINHNKMVIIDFWAPWCGPCRAFAPTFEKVSEKHPDVIFGKVNTEIEMELAQAFEIKSIPTLMVLKEQIVVFYQPGMLPEESFEDLVGKVKTLDMDEVRKEIDSEKK